MPPSLLYGRQAFKWQTPGASAPRLQVTFQQGSAFFESDRAAREANIGPSIGPMIIGVPSSGAPGDRAFQFRQLDAAGTPTMPETASLYPALAGYSVEAVDLPAGILTSDDVAAAFETVAAGIYASVTRVGSVVVINDDVDAALAFLPSSTSGGGGILGTDDIQGPNDFVQSDSNLCTLLTPAFPANAYLWAIQVKMGPVVTPTVADRLRMTVYLGGGINAPAGSTILYDFGQLPASIAPNEYATLYCNDLVQVPASSRLQVLMTGAGGTTTEVNYQNAIGAGGWDISPGGIWQVSGVIGVNPTVAPPPVFPAGGSNVSGTFSFNVRLIYRLAPFFADGQLYTQYGVHVAAAAMASRSNFTGNVFTGGNLPPPIDGLGLDYMAIASEFDGSFRYGAFQGGIIENPNAGDLLYDFGRGPAGPGLPVDFYQLDVPPATHVPVDRTQPVWAVGRNSGTAAIAFYNSGGGPGGGGADPDTNPMDWPSNSSNPAPGDRPEYETLNTNPNFSVDPNDPFETPFVADASDFLPGNVPGMRLGFRVRPVLLQAI